jgi:hypothetical protein
VEDKRFLLFKHLLNVGGRCGMSDITVHNTNGERNFGDISYVWERRANSNKSNGRINVEADEYDLYLSYNSWSSLETFNIYYEA